MTFSKVLCLQVYLGLTILTTAIRLNYTGDIPYLTVSFDPSGNETFEVPLYLEGESFFLGEECADAGTCTETNHSIVYNPGKYHGVKGDEITLKSGGTSLFGNKYQGSLITDFTNDRVATFNVINNSTAPIDLEAAGRLSLDFSNYTMDGYFVENVFKNLQTKQIIFRRGPVEQYLKTGYINGTKGAMEIGVNEMYGCNMTEAKYKVKHSRGWKIVGGIQIGDELHDYPVKFSLNEKVLLPRHLYNYIYQSPYKNLTLRELASYTLYFDNETAFAPNYTNFLNYKTIYRDVLDLQVEPHDEFVVLLGRPFLADFCLILRKRGDELSDYEIGLAPSYPLDDDPQWEDDVAPIRPKEDDDEDESDEDEDDGANSNGLSFFIVLLAFFGSKA
ncbi:unnamed protein product [Bursaphelenchus xylophilus]|uniref:(pine wood nematode) hypothetical protein n=1 Tax=Bursaphelenchus xylophilus TaxID=6326 RepID=A0A1I7RVV7_BURXY|nr:unnamed protein product [Bursaphelenchus xylophilus]CAG9094759.1 unnamed protein product [Bursaphelenchus xylophilus]